jgi:hypothetical protein
LGNFGRWKFGDEDFPLKAESSANLVEQSTRASFVDRVSNLSVSSRFSHSAMSHNVDGLNSLRASSSPSSTTKPSVQFADKIQTNPMMTDPSRYSTSRQSKVGLPPPPPEVHKENDILDKLEGTDNNGSDV